MKVTAHLHYSKNAWDAEGCFQLWPCILEFNKDKMFIKTLELEIEDTIIPTKEEITHWLITGLRKEKEAILADTHMKVYKIDEQIQELLCLPAPAQPEE